MAIDIRPITESHIEPFRCALDAVAREKKYLALVEAPPLAHVTAFVMSNIESQFPHFVALDDSTVVGWCDIRPPWAPAMRHRGTLGMGLIASHRGQGIGQRLMHACVAAARVRGITRVELEVRTDNAAAIRAYEKFGFIREATLRHALRIDDEYFDCLLMSLIEQRRMNA